MDVQVYYYGDGETQFQLPPHSAISSREKI